MKNQKNLKKNKPEKSWTKKTYNTATFVIAMPKYKIVLSLCKVVWDTCHI